MTDRARTSNVLIALVVSMTAGALILIAIDGNALSAGPFSLASYTSLGSIEKVAQSPITIQPNTWRNIEVSFSYTIAGDLAQLTRDKNITSPKYLNYHFVISNGSGQKNGKIVSTEKWNLQRPAIPTGKWQGSPQTIRMCIVADPIRQGPTECQIKRTQALIETLSRNFNIPTEQIRYPINWQY